MNFFALPLIAFTALLAIYDHHTQRVPNWATLPLLLGGFSLHFPGTLPLWAGTLFLFLAWIGHALGGGDAKLWMALLWLTPPEAASGAVIVMGLVLLGTATLQLAWRALRNRPVLGVQSPGAWRVIPFVLWLFFL